MFLHFQFHRLKRNPYQYNDSWLIEMIDYMRCEPILAIFWLVATQPIQVTLKLTCILITKSNNQLMQNFITYDEYLTIDLACFVQNSIVTVFAFSWTFSKDTASIIRIPFKPPALTRLSLIGQKRRTREATGTVPCSQVGLAVGSWK